MFTILSNKYLWALILLLIILRIPTFNRPISKHHEYNTAAILINAESWRQAGGGAQVSFTPFMNYQGQSNRVLDKGFHLDSNQHHVYLSFGAGWFLLPYMVLTFFHLPFTPAWLQILNIIINIISVCLLYRLLYEVTQKYNVAWLGAALFALLPAPLWYCGNGYVTVGIMMPLVILIAHCWHKFEKDANNINIASLSSLFLLSVCLCYFDWFAVFLVGAMGAWASLKARKSRIYLWVTVVAFASLLTGVWLVLAQFAHYLGWQQVLSYWQSRFVDRSTDTSSHSFATMLLMISKNLLTGYLPLFLLLPFVLIIRKLIKNSKTVYWPLWCLAAIIPYNGLFFNWSAEHEFAWMAFALVGTVCISIYLMPFIEGKKLYNIMLILIFISLVQYFVINRPGAKSWKGERYAAQKELGNWINANIDSTLPIFTNLENDKITEFYSKRTFNSKPTLPEAIQLAENFGVKKGVWLQIENNAIVKAIPMSLP